MDMISNYMMTSYLNCLLKAVTPLRVSSGRLRQAAAGCGRLRQAAAGCGRLRQAAQGCARLRKAAQGCARLRQVLTSPLTTALEY